MQLFDGNFPLLEKETSKLKLCFQGDSGSPLFLKDAKGEFLQIGVLLEVQGMAQLAHLFFGYHFWSGHPRKIIRATCSHIIYYLKKVN